MTDEEMVGWHHQGNGCAFEHALGAGEGQRGLAAAIHGVTKGQTQLSG